MSRNIERDFYAFVKAQLEKKQKQKLDSRRSAQEEDIDMNRRQNQNIQKVLLQERKRMKINKVTKEMQFENRFKEFSQMGTFIDVKQFLKGLNQHSQSNEKKKEVSTFRHLQSNTDSEDMFDYQEIVTKSKKYVAKNSQYRTKPQIAGYLVLNSADYESNNEDIEEDKSDNAKFYTGIDKLITDINQQDAYQEQDRQYERERKKHRDSMKSLSHQAQHKLLNHKSQPNFMKDDEAMNIEKEFKEKSQLVLQLLEKTTKMLYSNKKRPILKQPKMKSKLTLQQTSQQPSQILQTSMESKNTKSRSSSKVHYLSPNSSGPKIFKLPKLSNASIPEEWTQTPIANMNRSVKTQFNDFIIKVDRTKEEFERKYPNEQQITNIFGKMKRNMNKIGKQPLEGLKMLGATREPYRSQHRPSKKKRLMQIL